MLMKKFDKKGFTLAELLIVVAIIAVLVAIALPAYSKAMDNAKIATHEANGRTFHGEAVIEWMNDGKPDNAKYEGSYSGVNYVWVPTTGATGGAYAGLQVGKVTHDDKATCTIGTCPGNLAGWEYTMDSGIKTPAPPTSSTPPQ